MDFPGGPGAKTPLSQVQGAQVRSLGRELDPTCTTKKILHATPNTLHSQIKHKKEEVNPGLRCAGLEFLQDTPPLFSWIGLLHSLSDYTACLRGDGIVFMHFPNFAGKGQLSKPKQMGTGWSASHSGASLCVFCFSFLLPYLRKESEVACNPMDWSLPGSSVHGIFLT